MLTNVIVSAIVVTGVILLINVLIMRSRRGTTTEALKGGTYQRLEDENRRLADEPAVLSVEDDSRLTQQPDPDLKLGEAVTPFPRRRRQTEAAVRPATRSSRPMTRVALPAKSRSSPMAHRLGRRVGSNASIRLHARSWSAGHTASLQVSCALEFGRRHPIDEPAGPAVAAERKASLPGRGEIW
jgi:hypothetical protein